MKELNQQTALEQDTHQIMIEQGINKLNPQKINIQQIITQNIQQDVPQQQNNVSQNLIFKGDLDILEKLKKYFGKKNCTKINFADTFDNREKKLYEKYTNCCCNKSGILTSVIISIILNCAAIYFAISRNEGYNINKLTLEQNLTTITTNFPDDELSLNLIKFLDNKKNVDEYKEMPCPYEDYRLLKCSYEQYSKYCSEELFNLGGCSYMDFLIYNESANLSFCDLENYTNNSCTYIQYLDHEERYVDKIIEGNPPYLLMSDGDDVVYIYYLRGFSFHKFWCQIGNYDMTILITTLIILIIYLIILIFDSCCYNKKTITNGITYYIIIISYMIISIIMIFIWFLLLLLLLSSLFITISGPPKTYTYSYYHESTNENEDQHPATKKWKDNTPYAIIYCIINFLLIIFVYVDLKTYKIIYSYLSFDFEIPPNQIKRKASIKIENKYYNIELYQKENIYLKDITKIYEFKKIIFNNDEYYLKVINQGLKDQLSWSDLRYPKTNEGYYRLEYMLKNIFFILFFLIFLTKLQVRDEFIYKYYRHLIELGYRTAFYSIFDSFGEWNMNSTNILLIIYIILGIIILILLFIRAFFGGFANEFLLVGNLIFAIVFNILNCLAMILCIYLTVCLILSYIFTLNIRFLEEQVIDEKFIVSIYFYGILIFLFLILFIFSIQYSKYLYNNINENKILGKKESRFEEAFKFTDLDGKNKIFEVDNSKNLPKKLFYREKILENNPNDDIIVEQFNQSKEKILGIQLYNEECLNSEEEKEFFNYTKEELCGKGLICNIFYLIIISAIIFIFMIIALSTMINSNNYYKTLKISLVGSNDNSLGNIYNNNDLGNYLSLALPSGDIYSNLPTFTRLWCDFGKFENGVLVSYFVFLILFILFEIFSFLVHKRVFSILSFNVKKGIFYNIIIMVNIIFYILFLIYIPLFLYLLIYSVIVTGTSPFQGNSKGSGDSISNDNELVKLWKNNKVTPIVNCIIKLIIFGLNFILLNIKYIIIHYISLDYGEEDKNQNNDNNNENGNVIVNVNNDNNQNNNDNINENENEKTTSIIINNNKYKVKVNMSEYLYIKQAFSDKIFKFKKILLEGVTNGYIYVKLGVNSITDQISIGQWDYPIINETFERLASISKQIYLIIILLIPLLKLHLLDEKNFNVNVIGNSLFYLQNENGKEKGPIFLNIFRYYGSFEKSVNSGRLSLYITNLIIILLILLKRIYFGGFSRPIFHTIQYIVCIIFTINKAINLILNFILALFGFFSIICYYDGFKDLKDDMIQSKLFIQTIFNIAIFIINIVLLINSIKFCSHLKEIKNDLYYLINPEQKQTVDESQQQVEFAYITFDQNISYLREYSNEILRQKYLYYTNDLNENNSNINHERERSHNNLIINRQ